MTHQECSVSVIGYSCISALGRGAKQSLDNIFAGVVNITEPQCFSTTHEVKYPVMEVCNRDSLLRDKEKLNMTALLTLETVKAALLDAGITKLPYNLRVP